VAWSILLSLETRTHLIYCAVRAVQAGTFKHTVHPTPYPSKRFDPSEWPDYQRRPFKRFKGTHLLKKNKTKKKKAVLLPVTFIVSRERDAGASRRVRRQVVALRAVVYASGKSLMHYRNGLDLGQPPAKEDPVYAAIRQGKAKTGMAKELTHRIKDGAIPIISVPGLREGRIGSQRLTQNGHRGPHDGTTSRVLHRRERRPEPRGQHHSMWGRPTVATSSLPRCQIAKFFATTNPVTTV